MKAESVFDCTYNLLFLSNNNLYIYVRKLYIYKIIICKCLFHIMLSIDRCTTKINLSRIQNLYTCTNFKYDSLST